MNRGEDLSHFNQDQTVTKKELLKGRGMWHDVKIRIIVAPSFSRLRRETKGWVEAHCECGWVETWGSYEAAKEAGDEHLKKVNGK